MWDYGSYSRATPHPPLPCAFGTFVNKAAFKISFIAFQKTKNVSYINVFSEIFNVAWHTAAFVWIN